MKQALALLPKFLSVVSIGAMSAPAAASPHHLQRVALEIARKLDVTSFPNSIGPRRASGKHSLADYGFDRIEQTPTGVELYEGGKDWMIGIDILAEGPSFTDICFRDQALNGGTYRASTPVLVLRRADGPFYGVPEANGYPSCPGAPPKIE